MPGDPQAGLGGPPAPRSPVLHPPVHTESTRKGPRLLSLCPALPRQGRHSLSPGQGGGDTKWSSEPAGTCCCPQTQPGPPRAAGDAGTPHRPSPGSDMPPLNEGTRLCDTPATSEPGGFIRPRSTHHKCSGNGGAIPGEVVTPTSRALARDRQRGGSAPGDRKSRGSRRDSHGHSAAR